MFQACITDQFFVDILNGVHQPSDTYKIALYSKESAPDKNSSLTAYNTTGELPEVGNYRQGGIALKGFSAGVLPGAGAYLDWDDPVWKSATFSADAAVIYNASKANKAIAVLYFGESKATNGPFSVELPGPGSTAIIVIARKAGV